MKRYFLSALGIAFAFAAPSFAAAATRLYFELPSAPVVAGESFPIRVLLDSDQPVNAYAVTVDYEGPVKLAGVNNANSIVTVTQGPPDTSRQGRISLRGGSFAPFSGVGGEIFTAYATADGTGTIQFSFREPAVYLANGKGTKVIPDAQAGTVAVGIGVAVAQAAPSDTTPPHIDFLSIVSNPFDSGRKLLGFSVTDEGSGVKTIEMRTRSAFLWSNAELVKNPTPLADNVWEADLIATDNAGNTTDTVVYNWTALFWFAGEVLLVLIGAIFILKIFLKSRR